MSKIAESKGATLAQVSIAWALKQNPWIVPIPGTTKESRLKENIQASEITFTDAEMKMINSTLSNIDIIGDRY
ncbi:aldo/keto reductase [Enterococcus thailandicus]|uniref:aldo/keto reductase n=1 Tax=Enterococcus thailandicus TaxID=417368 RepID=UPI0022EC0FC3|nr:aldo/keto reductase [Enterococcus thailandicus]MDA3972772.1 aldo/keto reductase [Enterococcus thailandicus]MDA3975268.1 aldo/keto reductase [Enterococcus thailandicus]MDA3980232.1 aldo/keto reductase [Enterococcus thailandicus]